MWLHDVTSLIVAAHHVLYYRRFLLPIYFSVGLFSYLLALRALKAVSTVDIGLFRHILGQCFGRIFAVLLIGFPLPQASVLETDPKGFSNVDEVRRELPESKRVAIDQDEFEALLADNKALLDRFQKLMKRVDELEAENRQLRSDLQSSNANLASLEASLKVPLSEATGTLRKEPKSLAHLLHGIGKRISSVATKRVPFGAVKYCGSCGNVVALTDRFCDRCGANQG